MMLEAAMMPLVLHSVPVPSATSITIVKASGERERFRIRKLERSVRRSGASVRQARATAAYVASHVRDGMTTREIFDLVRRHLHRCRAPIAVARYTLKDAMRRLGPAGYDFEVFVARILHAYGYATELPDPIPGMCVAHEVDIVAERDGDTAMIECKYRNEPGIHVRLKDIMATWARYGDLRDARAARRHEYEFTQCWVVCNTKITADGVAFGTCKGMRLIGWRYPEGAGLERMVEERHLYPVTVLRSVTPMIQERLAKASVMLCHDVLAGDPAALARKTGVPLAALQRVRSEITDALRC